MEANRWKEGDRVKIKGACCGKLICRVRIFGFKLWAFRPDGERAFCSLVLEGFMRSETEAEIHKRQTQDERTLLNILGNAGYGHGDITIVRGGPPRPEETGLKNGHPVSLNEHPASKWRGDS